MAAHSFWILVLQFFSDFYFVKVCLYSKNFSLIELYNNIANRKCHASPIVFHSQSPRWYGITWICVNVLQQIKFTMAGFKGTMWFLSVVLLNSPNLSSYFLLNEFERILLFIFSSLLCLINSHLLITWYCMFYVFCKEKLGVDYWFGLRVFNRRR